MKRTLRRVTGEWLPSETWVELVAAEVLSAIRLEDDVEQALASGAFDPALLPELAEVPEGVRIGAQHIRCEDSEVWVANVPEDFGRLYRACLCSVARRLGIGPPRLTPRTRVTFPPRARLKRRGAQVTVRPSRPPAGPAGLGGLAT